MFDESWMLLIFVICFFGMLFLSFPIAFVIGSLGAALLLIDDLPTIIITRRIMEGVNVFPLLAVPLFIFSGLVMGRGGLARRMVAFVQGLLGWIRGGLALANIGASMLFGGVSGAASADIASIGTIMIPAMEEEGYDRPFAAAITCTSATVGPIIPPSIPAVLYAYVVGDISVAGIFLANIVPGVMIGLSLMIVSYIIARKRMYPREAFVGPIELIKRFGDGLLGMMGFIIIVGGTAGGIYTATEAGGIAAIYALIIGMFVYREVGLKDLPPILLDTALTTALALYLLALTNVFSWYLSFHDVPATFADMVMGITDNVYVLLLIINVVLFGVGMFIDLSPAVMLIVPILAPLGAQMGLNPYHLASIVIVNLVYGLITPPVGTSLFVGCSVSKLPMEVISKEMVWPFVAMISALLVVTYVPEAVLFIPRAFGFIH